MAFASPPSEVQGVSLLDFRQLRLEFSARVVNGPSDSPPLEPSMSEAGHQTRTVGTVWGEPRQVAPL